MVAVIKIMLGNKSRLNTIPQCLLKEQGFLKFRPTQGLNILWNSTLQDVPLQLYRVVRLLPGDYILLNVD